MRLRGLKGVLRTILVSGVLGAVTAGAAHAATASVAGSPITSVTITAVVGPVAGNLLYPGGTGDAIIKITNRNPFPVTITALQLPTATTYAAGYRDARLSQPAAGCAAGTPSRVGWNFAGRTPGSSHLLASPLTIGANAALSVTLRKDVAMAADAPAACSGAYFALPALIRVTATGGTAAATRGPATDGWTS